jgi:hypothetical protein
MPVARENGFLLRPMRLSANRQEKWFPYVLAMVSFVVMAGVMALFAGGGIGRVLIGILGAFVLFGCHFVIVKHLFEKSLEDAVMLDNEFLKMERGGRRTGIALASIHHVEYRHFGFGNYAVVVLHDSPGMTNELKFIPADNVGWAPDGAHPVVDILLLAVQAARRTAQENRSV